MSLKIRSFSRLTIVFILAVTIPGGVLSYLSIQNITNLKELTERRIIEEERTLAEVSSINFQTKLNEIIELFSHQIDINNHHLNIFDSSGFIESIFIIDSKGHFIKPACSYKTNTSQGQSTPVFHRKFQKAENSEFISRNYTIACYQYLDALKYCNSNLDTAEVINALARIKIKQRKPEEAMEYYSIITGQYSSLTDQNGIPYLAYAIPQMTMISETNLQREIYDKIEASLEWIASGKTPLFPSTELILDEVSGWLIEDHSFSSTEEQRIRDHMQRILAMITFVRTDGELIKEYVLSQGLKDHIQLRENFFAIDGSSEKGEKSLVIGETENSGLLYGFKLNINKLIKYAIQTEHQASLRYDLHLELINTDYYPVLTEGEMVWTAPISPLCPNTSVLIKMQNEDWVKLYVRRVSWLYGAAIVLLLGGMILGVFLIIKDFQREKRLSQLRSDFVSNVTHELKTPLTSIYMFAESILLGRVKTKADQKEYLGIILKETDRLKGLINNILDFSRREKGKLEYHFTRTNISDVVSSAIASLDYWTAEKKFNVTTNIMEGIFCEADPDAMRQAVTNLLSNAIKYSRDRKEIMVAAFIEDNLAHIEVEDKGIGIQEDKIPHIFDKFYRIESEETRDSTGAGLGLTLVKEIVEAHQGKIRVESRPGHGSKFVITIKII